MTQSAKSKEDRIIRHCRMWCTSISTLLLELGVTSKCEKNIDVNLHQYFGTFLNHVLWHLCDSWPSSKTPRVWWMNGISEGGRKKGRVVSASRSQERESLSLSLMWGRKANFKAESSPILFSSEEPYPSSEGLVICLVIIWMLIVPFLHWLVEAIDLQTHNTPNIMAKCRGLAISLPPFVTDIPSSWTDWSSKEAFPSFPRFFWDFPEINNHS